jgi:shikimate dehydrogenase
LTRVYHLALLGDPVEHSRSPVIHRAALEIAGLSGDYLAIRADVEVLDGVIDALRSGRLHGANVTMPLKLAALERCDRLTEEASAAGSVNTLGADGGVVEGHSTDVVAFQEAFGGIFDAELVLVLGAGGSARAALAAWRRGGAHVSARDPARAEALASRFESTRVVAWGDSVDGALVINATPIGMAGEALPEPVLASATGLIDLPYSDRPTTPAVARAMGAGIPTVGGVDFLAMQAAASFEWWTGVAVDSDRLASVARNG